MTFQRYASEWLGRIFDKTTGMIELVTSIVGAVYFAVVNVAGLATQSLNTISLVVIAAILLAVLMARAILAPREMIASHVAAVQQESTIKIGARDGEISKLKSELSKVSTEVADLRATIDQRKGVKAKADELSEFIAEAGEIMDAFKEFDQRRHQVAADELEFRDLRDRAIMFRSKVALAVLLALGKSESEVVFNKAGGRPAPPNFARYMIELYNDVSRAQANLIELVERLNDGSHA